MITICKSNERGKTITDWLTSYHSFSFNHYYDPAHVNFGPLVVLNDDIIKPGTGFGTHPHENMEIVTYVLEGALEHKDSTGKREVLRAGEVGRMSAGTGIVHSEYNHSKSEPVHFLQVWFVPKQENMIPSHEQKNFSIDQRLNVWLPIASDNASLGGTVINSYAAMYVARLEQGHNLSYDFLSGRSAYFFVADGVISLNGIILGKGDSASVSYETHTDISSSQDSEIVLFDVML
jgi:redox-sensitive bicupin YhaK (pirin superfamily)